MSEACPLNFIPIDSNAARLSSLIVSILVIMYVITLNEYILYFLLFDFVMKLFIKKDSSPIFIFAVYIRDMFNIKEKLTDGGAKRLAGMFGFTFVVLLIITDIFNLWIPSLIIATIFVVCLLLDIFANFCIGCKIYFVIKKIYPSFMN